MVAEVILVAALAYLLCGLIFAVAFVARGVGRLDHAARESSLGFRLIILPGSAALWPLLAVRWAEAGHQGENP